MADFEKSIVEEYIVESNEHLESIEVELLDLEKEIDNVDSEKINKIFRAIHSIKGASGFLGFEKIGTLSHVMETILSMMRSEELHPGPVIIGELLKGVDCLNTMFDDVNGSNEMDIEELHSSLLVITGQNKPDCESNLNKELPQGRSEIDEQHGFIINEKCLSKIPRGHDFLFVLEYDLLEISKKNKNLSEFASDLEGLGQIIDTVVIRNESNLKTDDLSSPIISRVLFSSVLDAEMIGEGAGLEKENIFSIKFEKNRNVAKDTQSINDVQIVKKPNNSTKLVPDKKVNKSELKNMSSGIKEKQEAESIRINVNVLDRLMTLAGELVLVRNQCVQAVDRGMHEEMVNTSRHLDMITTELQEAIMLTRMQPVGNVFSKLPRIVRDLSIKLGKKIEINTIGNDVEIDKTILQALADPLTHLVRNCCDHAIELPEERELANKSAHGTVTVKAFHEAGQINIVVQDDGKGLDVEKIKNKALENNIKTKEELDVMSQSELLSLIMLPGFSTAKVVSDVSGRGVGMDVVKSSIEKLGGEVEVKSIAGEGASIHMRLPLTLAIIPSLVVGVNGQRYAIPQVSLEELVSLDHEDDSKSIENTESQEVYRLRDHLLPIVRFREVLQRPDKFTMETHSEIIKKYQEPNNDDNLENKSSNYFAVVKVRGQRYGLVVDEVFGTEEIVVKPMHIDMKKYEIYSGATVMGDGKVALILSTEGIAKHVGLKFNISQEEVEHSADQLENIQTVLMFKSGNKEQFAVPMNQIRRVEKINADSIELVGDKEFITIDDISTFILRLDNVLDVSPCLAAEELYLLMPKNTKRPFGILMSRVVDIVEAPSKLNKNSYLKKGVAGTSVIRDHMTMFLDILSLIEEADQEWFLEYDRVNKNTAGLLSK
ncbi:MAG: hypothetical protein COA79_07735 [Planctomycetota bacterium]|nr:MAG: hypothetical protein COA79_07735 [Planctomycetota bacterium]